MDIIKLAQKIRAYRKACVAWYLNQADQKKCKKANRLEKQISQQISHLNTSPEIYFRLSIMFQRAQWSTTRLSPKR